MEYFSFLQFFSFSFLETGAFFGLPWKEQRRFCLHVMRDIGLGKSKMEELMHVRNFSLKVFLNFILLSILVAGDNFFKIANSSEISQYSDQNLKIKNIFFPWIILHDFWLLSLGNIWAIYVTTEKMYKKLF